MSPADEAAIQHIAADLTHLSDTDLARKAAEVAALPGVNAAAVRHAIDAEQEFRLAYRHAAQRDELLAMLRHAAKHYGLHHIAAINEIRALDRAWTTDEEFRAKTIAILAAVLQVDEEIDATAEAVTR